MTRVAFLNFLRIWVVALAVLACGALPGAAQLAGLGALGGSGGETKAEADGSARVTQIIEEAARNGLGVIVIDADGNLVSPNPETGPETPAASEVPAEGSPLMKAQETVNSFRSALFARLADLPSAVREVMAALRASSPTGSLWAYVEVLLWSLGLFAIGMVAQQQIYGRRIARHFIVPLIKENPVGYSGKMPFLTIRFIGGVIGILFSMLVAYIIGYILFGELEDPALQYTAALINIGYFSARTVTALWRMILSPYLAQYRIPRLDDRDSRRLFLWLSVVVTLGFFTMLFNEWLRELGRGLGEDVSVFVTLLLSFFMVLLNFALVLVNRRAITGALLNGRTLVQASWPVRVLARFWVPVVMVYLVFGWLEHAYDLVLGIPAGVPLVPGAYAILTVVMVVYGVMNFYIERGFARARAMREANAVTVDPDMVAETVEAAPSDEAQAEQTLIQNLAQRPQLTTFEGLAQRVAAIVAFVAGGYAFVGLWQPDSEMMVENSLVGQALDIVVIIFLGYIGYHAFRIWIDGKIREEQGDDEPAELGDEGGGSSATRLATLLPLFRNVILIVIIVTIVLIALMEMGVNVGPLFAGAGIVGVAVGFGSQSLVRDIFSGAFFLFDDAFRKGEYIEIGDVRGTVENISVRSFQLRHHLGKLHTIPFGEIQVLTNYSRDWVMMKLPLRVTYDTDVEKVRKLIKKLGQRLLEDPVIGEDFLAPLKSQGVIEMQDSAMIIRVKFMTKPGDQWVIRKRVFQEIRDLFEREGIRFAHREVTVRLADGTPAEDLTPDQRNAALSAAQAVVEEEENEGPGGGGDDR